MKQDNSYSCVIDEVDLANMANVNVFEWVVQGDFSALDYLSRKSPTHLSSRDENGARPIHYAAASGHVDIIRLIVSMTGPEELDAQDAEGQTPLHFAVLKNQESSCSVLLDMGANPNTLNTAMMAPIHLAISKEYNNLVQVLLSCSRTDVNLEGDLGNTPVMLACSYNNCEALHTLFKYGAKLCHQNKLGHFAIHTVAFSGAKEAMEVILQKGEDLGISTLTHINYLDKSKSSPLHLAVRGGNTEVIKLCISKGAKVDQQQCDKSTALHFACTQGAMEAVKAMLLPYDKRIDEIINIRDAANQAPLHRATLFDHVELAKYLVSKGADINCVDCKGFTPLLLATTSSAWKTVSFLLSKDADFRIKDKTGRNFLHLAIFQPKGLKNLPEHILQNKEVWELMSDEDFEGCTPLHYACKLGIHDSVKNMLGFEISLGRKSKEKKSALHFAAEYGRINTCLRLLETIRDSRLLNEGDENGLTPLHLASRGGHIKVVDLLLRRGALFQSDYKGWSCLHHAAAEGYTQTMNVLLAANVKLLDNTDEDGNTALHLAAREGHVAAVKLLLNLGAEILLNNNHASFFHEAVRSGKKDVTNAAIDNERLPEIIPKFKMGYTNCPVLDLIEILPESTKHLLDLCMTESEHDPNSTDYHITYNFRWLQAPLNIQKTQTDKAVYVQPLAALNAMVQYNRLELLTHPVCQKYLEMKWKAYGSKAHLLNLAVYLLGLLPLTYLVMNLKPTQISTTNGTTFIMENMSFHNQSYIISVSMLMVLVMNIYAICKEVIQMAQQRMSYFLDSSNISDWATAISSIAFVTPMFFNVEGTLPWQAGALAILFAWINFLLYFQRFERFGIYVIMFGEITKTLVSVLVLFIFLLLAFGLSFHALMLHQGEFNSIGLSLAQTFVMTVGELNYETSFQEAYLQGLLPFPAVTYYVFVFFILLMPILFMNLMIGLAVGDIAEVQRNAALKRIAMQIELHTNLEEKLPYWFMNRVDKGSVTIYPNRKCAKFQGMLEQFIGMNSPEGELRTRLDTQVAYSNPLEIELMKQKARLKQISSSLEKQDMLLKLIVQKMEITTEADDNDGPDDFRSITTAKLHTSRWVPLMQALGVRKSQSTC
ncbi:transient receptor potential cation channel subfamily A member 1b [Tachysurus vachellii]|uniref:transient receptor potential cation channel subfamily A member 1b n=1 Tax=Tachysurus vachellii TaxID=175792 RepID=UPI00296AD58B|nr:transient receptor potential cation channel subfamily A member 1b [Tachysurus vachellii]XP_060717360.1 transient receptor potential cation channel subfamily A member 1b [Tachysurus vachellii]